MGLLERSQRAAGKDPASHGEGEDGDPVGDEECQADPTDRRGIGEIVGVDLRAGGEDVGEGDAEGQAEDGEDNRQDRGVEEDQAPTRPSKERHPLLDIDRLGSRSRYPKPRMVSMRPSRRPPSSLRRRERM